MHSNSQLQNALPLPELIDQYSRLLPGWQNAYELECEAQNQMVLWRISNRDTGRFVINGEKKISAVCGFDLGVQQICDHYEILIDDRTPQQRDIDLEAAIERLSNACKALEAVPVEGVLEGRRS